jgi:hypothetical protein
MTSAIYLLAYYYPFWAFPLAYIIFELGNSHRKRGHLAQGMVYVGISVILVSLIVLFFVFNGFDTLLPAMKRLESKYL